MTNGEKYQTIKEQIKAFETFCSKQHNFCLGCPYFPRQIGVVCFANWLELEAESEEEINDERENV